MSLGIVVNVSRQSAIDLARRLAVRSRFFERLIRIKGFVRGK